MAKGPKGMFNSENLLGQMRQMQEQLKIAQKELEKEEFSADIRGGAIKVTFTGGQVCKAVEIDSDLCKNIDSQTMGVLLAEVINKALDKVRKQTMKKLGPISGMGR
ncbi:MAG TPA: YbaB/EbfC family nucleoid-associated protein [Anaerolineaceae bacterium]|jgi:DNA-binding YbaB/EbfC family protein|nr:YbaB/EbfC family nucleoid-associated protein [Anaerolineaceae bacterium]